MPNPILHANDITYLYPSGKGAQKISFCLEKGEFLVLAGPNGAGKSTLLKMLVGALKKQTGSITINGNSIESLSRKEFAQDVAYITQSPSQAPISLWDYISLGLYPRIPNGRFWLTREEKIRITEMMQFVGLTSSKEQLITKLSGGEMQLAQICRALLQQPQILLMDEPVAHLDPGHAIVVLDLVSSLQKEKKISIISVLHEINLAAEYADRILFLNESQQYALGTPQELMGDSFLSELYNIPMVSVKRPHSGNPALFPIPQKYQK